MGRGIPMSQSSAPLPKPIVASCFKLLTTIDGGPYGSACPSLNCVSAARYLQGKRQNHQDGIEHEGVCAG